ncbi:MFS transporter [Acidaminococcus sp.]|uniref:MFS transporter n=1 Tax=Acidaminococcus sp. TaxID=1872103 RepID=UPI003AB4AE4D
MSKDRLWTPQFITMGGGNFFYFLSQYLLVAAMPLYILEELHGSERDAGLAMTYFQLGTVLCRPFAGKIIDSLNKHRLLVTGSCAFLLIMTAFFFLRTLPAVFGLRFLHGAAFGITSTAAAAVAALVLPLSRKGEGIGYFALSTNLAMVAGPLVGLVLMQYWGPSAVFFFLILGALFTLIAMLRTALPISVTRPSASFRSFSATDFIEPRSVIPSLFGGLVFFSYGGMLTFIPLYARSLGLGSVTSLFFVVFALIIIVTRPVIGHLFDTKGPDYTVYPGFIIFLLGFILFASISSLTGLLLSGAVLGLGFGALSPAFQTLAVTMAPPFRAGVATATYFWALDISVGLAAYLLGLAAAEWGYAMMYGVICPAVLVGAAVLYLVWRRMEN